MMENAAEEVVWAGLAGCRWICAIDLFATVENHSSPLVSLLANPLLSTDPPSTLGLTHHGLVFLSTAV